MRKYIAPVAIWKIALRKSNLTYFPAGHRVISGGPTSFIFFSPLWRISYWKTPCLNFERHRVDGGTSSDSSFEDLKNRGRYYEKHAMHPLDALQPLSFQRSFYSYSAQTCADLIIFVLPRHGKNNGGTRELCLKSENNPKSSQKYLQINS